MIYPNLENVYITIGSFDGVHSGHQKIVDRLQRLSSELNCENVVITFDTHPRNVVYPKDKSLKLLSSLKEKIELFSRYGVQNLIIVPFTIEFSQIPALEYIDNFLVQKFNPSHIVIGYDHRFGLNRVGDIDMLRSLQLKYGYQIIEIPKYEIDEITISSTKIRNALDTGDLTSANTLLNHPYEISGIVIRGRKLGTEIGFPTANLEIENKQKLVPKDGIYACFVKLDNVKYQGMLYIGDIPTIGTDNPKSIEVNIFDFNDDIYGNRISVQLLHFLRSDKKFNGLNELKEELIKDRANSLEFFETYLPVEKSLATIAILNYNTVHFLESYLPSVSYSSNNSFQTIIIDNDSDDTSVTFVEEWFPEIKVIQLTENYGFATGYNIGLKDVTNKYIALLNTDVLVSENWLDPILEFLEKNPEYACAMPKIRSIEKQENFEYAGAAGGFIDYMAYPFCRGRVFDTVEVDEGQYDDISDIFWASGAAFVIRTDLFKKFGGFDADFFAHQEEIDFCWRLQNAGYKIAVIPESKVFHMGGGTLNYGDSKKMYLNFRNNLFTFYKNENWYNIIWKIPFRLVLDGIAGLKFLVDQNWSGVSAIIKAHFSFYGSIFKLTKKRFSLRKIRLENKISNPNKSCIKSKSIIFQYFILGKRKFSDIFT